MNASQKRFFYALFAFLAAGLAAWGQDFIEVDLRSGATVSGLRQQHQECIAVPKNTFYADCAKLNGFENTDDAYRHLRPRKIKLPVVSTSVSTAIEVEEIEAEPAAPASAETHVEQKPVAQIEMATIILDTNWLDQVDWESEVLQSENENLAHKLAEQSKTIAKLNDMVANLQNELVAEQSKPAETVPFPIRVEIPREQNLTEVVAEPMSFMALSMLLSLMFMTRFNYQLRKRVKGLELTLAVAWNEAAGWRQRAQQKTNQGLSSKDIAELALLRSVKKRFLYEFVPKGGTGRAWLEKAETDENGNTISVWIKGIRKPIPTDFITDALRACPETLKQLAKEGFTLPEDRTDPVIAALRRENLQQIVGAA